eukprot:c5084_g1_i1.p1 GENE.c5084_g1_i1~~c5084_g1_i1.p1  ORF type:complete len:115 (+),score=35.22 c5084_g1_i1:90-434(+)
MESYNISGLPVVDEKFRLVGQITAAHLRPFLANGIEKRLDVPVKQFVPHLSIQSGSSIAVKTSTPVKDMIAKFVTTKSHRLYLVDGEQMLIGVCSLKNALQSMMDPMSRAHVVD